MPERGRATKIEKVQKKRIDNQSQRQENKITGSCFSKRPSKASLHLAHGATDMKTTDPRATKFGSHVIHIIQACDHCKASYPRQPIPRASDQASQVSRRLRSVPDAVVRVSRACRRQ